jgi:putative endonuclease
LQWIKELSKRSLGQHYERLASKYLQQQGLELLVQNYTCKAGEIDLVMRDAEALVFVEVKYRKSANYGHSSEMISADKLRKVVKAAQHYMQSKDINEHATLIRFDAIAISGDDNAIEWFKNIQQ